MWDGERSVQSRGRPWVGLVTSGGVVWRVSVPQLRLQHSTAPHFPTPDSADLAGGLYMGSGVPMWEGSCDAA